MNTLKTYEKATPGKLLRKQRRAVPNGYVEDRGKIWGVRECAGLRLRFGGARKSPATRFLHVCRLRLARGAS